MLGCTGTLVPCKHPEEPVACEQMFEKPKPGLPGH
jgi:hypothetical protein